MIVKFQPQVKQDLNCRGGGFFCGGTPLKRVTPHTPLLNFVPGLECPDCHRDDSRPSIKFGKWVWGRTFSKENPEISQAPLTSLTLLPIVVDFGIRDSYTVITERDRGNGSGSTEAVHQKPVWPPAAAAG
jgi:hypothetical protein